MKNILGKFCVITTLLAYFVCLYPLLPRVLKPDQLSLFHKTARKLFLYREPTLFSHLDMYEAIPTSVEIYDNDGVTILNTKERFKLLKIAKENMLLSLFMHEGKKNLFSDNFTLSDYLSRESFSFPEELRSALEIKTFNLTQKNFIFYTNFLESLCEKKNMNLKTVYKYKADYIDIKSSQQVSREGVLFAKKCNSAK